MTDDFFRNRLDQMIDLRHPLAVLANHSLGKKSKLPLRSAGRARSRRARRSKTWTCLVQSRLLPVAACPMRGVPVSPRG